MRTSNSVKNVIASTSVNVIAIIMGFIAQRIFVSQLGIEYLGINGLFTNIVSMLGVVELGFGTAIIYSLYKPIADGDHMAIKSLMRFYRDSYRIIALIITAIGLCVIPFLEIIVGETSIVENLTYIYLLFLLDVVLSYLLTYKRSILYADQKNHIINTVHIAYTILVNVLQILILIFTANFILYLAIKIFMRITENVILNVVADKLYPILKEGGIQPLDSKIKNDIFTKLKGLFYHKIGSFVVLGSDNIIISIFLGIATVGLYANYLLVIMAISTLINQAFSAVTASIGNLLVTGSSEKSYETYRRVRFANFWLAALVAISLLVSMDSLIQIWLGGQFILPIGVLVVLCINLFLNLFRSGLSTFKDAAAIFHEDRFIPVLQSIVNIIVAVIMLHFFGLAGVFIGTICSTLLLHLYSYPRYVYTRLFKQTYRSYYLEFSVYLVVALIVGLATFFISRLVVIENDLLQLLTNVFISLTIPNLAFYALYRKSDEFTYYKNLFTKIVHKVTRRQ